ncbi:MAG TPA: hypothetical protein PL033_09930 [Candidatus Brocadiia bacterium]|nr:hypothetical protein [Candidatus Brocadiia bacterium]
MVRRMLALGICIWMFAAASCSIVDPDDNRRRLNVMKTDLDLAVEDLDFILGLDRPSRLVYE